MLVVILMTSIEKLTREAQDILLHMYIDTLPDLKMYTFIYSCFRLQRIYFIFDPLDNMKLHM